MVKLAYTAEHEKSLYNIKKIICLMWSGGTVGAKARNLIVTGKGEGEMKGGILREKGGVVFY